MNRMRQAFAARLAGRLRELNARRANQALS
jgi:hypothetical protein